MAGGSVSLHASYVLYARRRRVTPYIPDAIAAPLERAVQNGRTLHDLIVEAGERYLRAP